MKHYRRRNLMSKSKENNINKIGERLIKNIDLYDGPVMVDNGEIKFEKEAELL